MEQSAWTDERLNDRFDEIDRRFDRVDTGLRDLRLEVAATREQLNARIDALGSELRGAILRTNLMMMAGFLGLLAAVLTRGG
ncbi:MAG: hypothetical protein ACRDKH_08070 [Solirubrobacterales bacterium]